MADSRDAALLRAVGIVRGYRRRGGSWRRGGGEVTAVAGVSLEVGAGEVYGLVGRSGAGKTTLGKVLCGLETPDEGHVLVEGRRLQDAAGRVDRQLRRRVQMVFQDAAGSLDPLHSVERIVAEPLAVEGTCLGTARLLRVRELLEAVELPGDGSFLARKPHQLSGGERQRVVIARALACEPRALVLDEPVSALDVSIRGQVLNLLRGVSERFGLATVLISHDVGVVRWLANRLGVMLAGRIVEEGPAAQVLDFPRHPFTLALAAAARLTWTEDAVEDVDAVAGCPHARVCRYRSEACANDPALVPAGAARKVACHSPLEA